MSRLTFDDVLIQPNFSTLDTRAAVDLSTELYFKMGLPVFSANMASITESSMCKAMSKRGAMGVLHRFNSIEDNAVEFQRWKDAAVSVGLGTNELGRAAVLLEHGANIFFLDVAHGAQLRVAEQYKQLKELGCPYVVVGNFANPESISQFLDHTGNVDGIKIGVGPGSVCTTRIKTGVGVPQLHAIVSCSKLCKIGGIPIIADGGMRRPGDIAKALAAGADAVMLGGMFAGTDETPGRIINYGTGAKQYKLYSGSAYKTEYDEYCTSEGEQTYVSCTGPVDKVLAEIEGGLRSAFTYVGARTLTEFQEKAEFIPVSSATRIENTAHKG